MDTISKITEYVLNKYLELRKEGQFDPDCWDGDEFSLPLVAPWPTEYTISVKGYADYYDEDHHFIVSIQDLAGVEVTGCCSGEMDIYEKDLDYTLFRAFQDLCGKQWPDVAAETAWKAFLTIPVDENDRIAEPFLKFHATTCREEILAWFNRTYRLGLPALRARAEDDGTPLIRYKVPVVWQMIGYIEVVSKSKTEAFAYIRSPQCGLPEGSYLEDSFEIDESAVEELPV